MGVVNGSAPCLLSQVSAVGGLIVYTPGFYTSVARVGNRSCGKLGENGANEIIEKKKRKSGTVYQMDDYFFSFVILINRKLISFGSSEVFPFNSQ